MKETRVVVTVLGQDQKGIVAKVSMLLYECDANIGDIRQGVSKDIFSMTMMATLDEDVTPFNEVQERLDALGEELHLQIVMQREDVFKYMYNV
ncbi:MAG: ACT domain-containing protein [Coriobacteriaceae bacterium]|nr:ACT domain-containing protein [Coriobacteriaceae bacterium]